MSERRRRTGGAGGPVVPAGRHPGDHAVEQAARRRVSSPTSGSTTSRPARVDRGQGLLLALVFAVLFYVSILGHELAHAWVAGALGYPVHSITLWFLGGYTSYDAPVVVRLARGRHRGVRARSRRWLIGLAACAVAYSDAVTDERLFRVLARPGRRPTSSSAIYNALPGLPLDGGAVLKPSIWGITRDEHRGTVVAAWAGRVVAVAAVGVPLCLALSRGGAARHHRRSCSPGSSPAWLWSGASQALRQATVQGRVPGLTRPLADPAGRLRARTTCRSPRRCGSAAAGGTAAWSSSTPTGRATAVAQEAAVAPSPWTGGPGSRCRRSPRRSTRVPCSPPTSRARRCSRRCRSRPRRTTSCVDTGGQLLGVLSTGDVEASAQGLTPVPPVARGRGTVVSAYPCRPMTAHPAPTGADHRRGAVP